MARKPPVSQLTLQAALAGALGGFAGFLLSENTVVHWGDGGSPTVLVFSTALFSAVVALPLALALVMAENLLGLRGRWNRDLAKVVVPALVVGGIAGGAAQMLYTSLQQSTGQDPTPWMRALAWGLLGSGVGLLLGFTDRSLKKALRGLLGGTIGGFLGGLLFDTLTYFRYGPEDTGTLSRGVGLTLLGAAIGFMLSVAEQWLKSSWLLGTTTGPYEGKSYILGKNRVTVGRSDANDISLYHDRELPETLGALVRVGKVWHWEGQSIHINGKATSRGQVQAGDRLTLGSNEFLFQEKGKEARARGLTVAHVLHTGNQQLPLPVGLSKTTLGSKADLQLMGKGVQDRHLEMQAQDGELVVVPHASTLLNGQPLPTGKPSPLRPGDLLTVGEVEVAVLKDRSR